jgi:hypothetical protein
MDTHNRDQVSAQPARSTRDGAGDDDLALDRAIQQALSVEPSPEFVARVRLALSAEPRPAFRIAWWGIGISVLASVVLAVAVIWPARRDGVTPIDLSQATNVSERTGEAHVEVLIPAEERAGWRLLMAMVSQSREMNQIDLEGLSLDPLSMPADLSAPALQVEPIALIQ